MSQAGGPLGRRRADRAAGRGRPAAGVGAGSVPRDRPRPTPGRSRRRTAGSPGTCVPDDRRMGADSSSGSNSTATSPNLTVVPGPERYLARQPLAFDERPVGRSQVGEHPDVVPALQLRVAGADARIGDDHVVEVRPPDVHDRHLDRQPPALERAAPDQERCQRRHLRLRRRGGGAERRWRQAVHRVGQARARPGRAAAAPSPAAARCGAGAGSAGDATSA